MSLSLPSYLYLILLSEKKKKEIKKERRGQTLFYSNPKPGEPTQIQPNRIYSRVPLQMVICRLSTGLGTGAPVIDTPTTTQLGEEMGKGGYVDMIFLSDFVSFM